MSKKTNILMCCFLAAFTVVLPWMGFGDIVVTNSAELIRCLGYNGIAGIDFEIDATVVWETSAATKTFYVKTSDGYTRLTDKKFWPQMHLHNGDVIKASGTTASMSLVRFGNIGGNIGETLKKVRILSME